MSLPLEPITSGDAPGGGSGLDQIRALFQAARGASRLAIPLPGAIGEHVRIRYRPVSDDFQPSQDTPVIDVALDMLIDMTDAVLVRAGGDWEPLTHAGVPVSIGPELSDMLGLGVPGLAAGGTARDVMLALHRSAPKPELAVLGTFERLTEWLAGSREPDEERLLGES